MNLEDTLRIISLNDVRSRFEVKKIRARVPASRRTAQFAIHLQAVGCTDNLAHFCVIDLFVTEVIER